MLLTPLPFEYAIHLAPGDRIRKARKRDAARVRRAPKRKISD